MVKDSQNQPTIICNTKYGQNRTKEKELFQWWLFINSLNIKSVKTITETTELYFLFKKIIGEGKKKVLPMKN